jgi:hypothetical protein
MEELTIWREDGTSVARMVVGDGDDPDAPLAFRVYQPPGFTVASHTHECDYLEMVLEGSRKVGDTWYGPGDVKIVRRGTVYGPLIAGPEGVTLIVMFSDQRSTPVTPVNARDIMSRAPATD